MTARRSLLPLAALLALALPTTAAAGTPGKWTRVTTPEGRNIDEVALQRTADGVLHVAHLGRPQRPIDLFHTPITPAGGVGPATPIVSGWATMSMPDLVPGPGGGLRVFIPGIRSAESDANNSLSTATAPGTGSPWTLFGDDLQEGGDAHASEVGAALGPDGTPFQAWTSQIHRGLDKATPVFQFHTEGCCAYEPDLATDGATGQMAVGWYSNADPAIGIRARAIDPGSGAPAGVAQTMPGTVTGGESSAPLHRIAITGRGPGRPGIFLAAEGGYPTTNRVLVWRFGSAASTTLFKGATVRDAAIAAAPDGRLWVLWGRVTGSGVRVHARRSNPSVTAWGARVSVAAPGKSDTIWKLVGSAQTGRLDLLGSFRTAGSEASHFHTQLMPGLTLSGTLKGGTLKVKVTDAGSPVPGAKVRAAGVSKTTGANGRATLSLPGKRPRRSVVATAGKKGFVGAKRRVKKS
jgi:hypothetical protein